MKISIIIPTLNEVGNLRRTILHTLGMAECPAHLEIIVVDNGSMDGTVASVADLKVQTHTCPELKGQKYAVLNYGNQQSTGEVIVFLDADTLLPKNFDTLITQCLKDQSVVGGAFDFEFQERRWYLQVLAAANRIRIRVDKNFLGDQALFCRRSILEDVGGYPEKLIMESSFLCQTLKRHGQLSIIPVCIHTSARRFLEKGFLRVFWYDSKVWFAYLLGLDVNKYAAAYWKHNDQA